MLPSVKIHLHQRQQQEEVPKMSVKFVNLAKMGSNLLQNLTKSSSLSMRPLATSAVSCSANTNIKIEDKKKVSVNNDGFYTMCYTGWALDKLYCKEGEFRKWKRDPFNPSIIHHPKGIHINDHNFQIIKEK